MAEETRTEQTGAPDERAFHSVLVPLDGSALAETVLPAAVEFARRFGASVTLLHVIERGAPQSIHGEQHLADEASATRYLDGVAKGLEGMGVAATYHVHPNRERDVAASIAGHALELGNDLIVVATHGSGGLRDVVIGSIAEQVIGRGVAPVLLLRAGVPPAGQPFSISRMVVPLDGSADSERALPIARAIGRVWNAEALLVRVVPTRGDLSNERSAIAVMLPGTTKAILDLEEAAAAEYLATTCKRLGELAGIQATTLRGDPTLMVLRTVETCGADLVVMATHGRAGLGAFWADSVGHRLAEKVSIPLLIDATARR
jgi:nucleotide-binding universal stress UspA family protein